MDVRSLRAANIDSDHFLAMSKFRSRISNCKTGRDAKLKRCDTDKLKSVEVSAKDEQKINSETNGTEEKSTEDVDEQWNVISTAIVNCS